MSLCISAQDLSYCGSGYVVDLSVGYTATGLGLDFCGCSEEVSNCELVHIILQRTNSSDVTQLIECPDIVLTERWWREEKDLVDIYNAETCEEYEESDTHNDRYEINTDHLDAGDTLSILVCKTSPFDDNIIELSASPGPECSNHTCAPQITCPVEFKLRLNLECQYELPDFRLGVELLDTCTFPPLDVTGDYTIMQSPLPGTTVSEDLFVEIKVSNADGEIVATCDVSVILAPNSPPAISQPDILVDISVGDPLPVFQELTAYDTIADDVLYPIEIDRIIDPYEEDVCGGYAVTYRWMATDTCNLTTEITQTFNVMPNIDGPEFASLPADIDTVRAGESLPFLVDLIAVNPDGTLDGISMESSIDPYEIDDCFGYSVTYRWMATDSCGYSSELDKTFFVEPDGAPPIFTILPDEIENISTNDSFPTPQRLAATSIDGSFIDIDIVHSIDPYEIDYCAPYPITYRWTASDSCGLTAMVTQQFAVVPDTLSAFLLEGMGDMEIEVSIDCNQFAEIELPIDIIDHPDKEVLVTVTDEDWNVLDEYVYEGPTDYQFGSGSNHVIYSVSDLCGNEVRDTIDIFANDISAPIFICPSQQQIFVTDFGSCATAATWIPPQAFDNCDELDLNQTSGPQFGASLGVGVYEIVYEAVDGNDNMSSCSFELVVSPMSLTAVSCLPITVELDSMCDARITKEAIIGSELLVCAPEYTVEVIAGMDTLRGDTFNIGSYIGQEIRYILCDPILDICCENNLNLVDSIAPIIICEDTINISCLLDLDNYFPSTTLECGPIAWQFRDLDYNPICGDPDVRAQVTREFIATDEYGNSSEPCVQVINILYANIDVLEAEGLVFFPDDVILSCEDQDIEFISDSLFGLPMLDTFEISLELNGCGIKAQYEDEPLLDYGCTKVIKRHWTIIEELCDNGYRHVQGTQFIRIVDTVGPVMTPLIGIVHQNTSLYDCYGYFVMPKLEFTDNCQDEDDLAVVYQFDGVLYDQADTIRLPLGYSEITVISEDECRNRGYDTVGVEVIDEIRPVAACLEQTVISVTDEISRFPVAALNNGSYDNCEIASIQISKSTVTCSLQDTSFGDYIEFCCADIGQAVEVLLKVVDHEGNENICWGIVHVQEKLAPEITCPPSLVLDCAIDLTPSGDEADPYGHLFGRLAPEKLRKDLPIDPSLIISQSGALKDGSVYDICNEHVEVIVETTEDINQCGIGVIYRHFTAIDASGNKSITCTQTIEIGRPEKADSIDVIWPEEEIFIQECNTSPIITPDSLGRPIVGKQPCALFGISYDDTYVDFENTSDGACSKIIRTWTIIDWCADDPLSLTTTFNQVIKVSDILAPEIENCSEQEELYVSSQSEDCHNVSVLLEKQALDDCTNQLSLVWSVSLDYYNNGSDDYTFSLEPDSLGVSIETELPVGRHLITWTVSDKCGNVAYCEEVINVENAKSPTPIAHGISTTLSNHGNVVVWADDLILKIENECSTGGRGSISRASEDFDFSSDQITFTCEDIGVNVVKVYGYRTLLDGTTVYDYVTVIVDVEDNNKVCSPSTEEESDGIVSGLVYTIDGRLVPGVQLELNRAFPNEFMTADSTDNHGYFDLGELVGDETYFIKPSLNGNVIDGLNTLDIVIIQRHIMGIEIFDSPFQIIAADANKDGKVSVSDLLEIRKSILFLPSKLDQHNAWRFINADFPFYDRRYPLDDDPEEISYVRRLAPEVDIVAMKMGDLNSSVKIYKTEEAEGRSVEEVSVINKAFKKGETFTIEITSQSDQDIFGFQFNLAYKEDFLDVVDVQNNVSDIDFSYNEVSNKIFASGSSGYLNHLRREESIVSITFVARQNGSVENSISLSNEGVQSELYVDNLVTKELLLSFTSSVEAFGVTQNVPNPFTNATFIYLDVPESGDVLVEVFDATGKKVISRNQTYLAGVTQERFTKKELPNAGLYYYRVTYKNEVITKRMILLD